MEGVKKVATALWVLAALGYVGGLLAMYSGGQFLNVHYMTWYLNALVLGILSLGAKKVLG